MTKAIAAEPVARPGRAPLRIRPSALFWAEHGPMLLGSVATASLVLVYWALAAVLHPGEPARITVLYRFTDTDYLPAIYALARGEFGEITDPVTYGQGLLPFPALMLLPHALGVALLGDYGFAVADAAIALLHFLLAYQIVRLFVTHRGLAAATAFLIVVALFPGEAWSFRYPRPFVSHLFLMAMVAVGARVWPKLSSGRPWRYEPLLLGLTAGAASQGDFHAAVGYCIAIALLYGTWIYRRGRLSAKDLKTILWTGGGVALGLTPLFVHSLFASDELLARWGMYPVSRGQTTIQITTAVLLIVVLAVFSILLRLRLIRAGDPLAASESGLLAFMLCLCFGALAAGPLSTWILGKQIQVYQYQIRLGNAAQLALLISGWGILCHMGRRYPRLLAALALLLSAAPVGLILRSSYAQALMESQPRVFWNHPTLPGYRGDVAALFRELRKPAYRGKDVLGTFDQQLGMLWATGRNRTLFVPDTFLSRAPDAEIEARAIALSRLMGLDAAQFVAQARDEYFQKKFLTLGKWQLSRSYAAGDLRAYDAEQLRAGFTTSLRDNWHVELPLSEQRRLERSFATAKVPGLVPDMIILSVVHRFAALDPRPPYVLVYQNSSFRVFVRS